MKKVATPPTPAPRKIRKEDYDRYQEKKKIRSV